MQRIAVRAKNGFRVIASTGRSQAATMVVNPGRSVGGPDNRHAESDQWLYVLSGAGRVVIEGEPFRLEEGVLVLIEAGEEHAIQNDGTEPLRTLNVYAPPEY